ncbi:MAG: ANTAR domain-containing protein [Propionibacteriaceae bacterium]
MVDQNQLLKTLSRFAQALPLPYDLETVLTDLVESVVRVLGLAGSGVTLAQDGRLVFFTAAGPGLAELERTQEQHQQGPCRKAFASGQIVTVSDLAARAVQWPDYVAAAQRIGIASVAGIPMKLGDRTFGALNLYTAEAGVWPEADLEAAQVLADVATSYLVNGSNVRQLEQLNEQLQQALQTRIVIEQAKGVIANCHGVSVDDAFSRIRTHARTHNATVRAVAEAVVHVGLQL